MKNTENVYEAIRGDDRFKILSKIPKTTGIGEAMASEREAFTFFAPTGDAFRWLSKSALILLTSPDKDFFGQSENSRLK